jgi:hypothetical protein
MPNYLVDIGDPSAPIGSPPWCKYAHGVLCTLKRRTDSQVSSLKYSLLEFRNAKRWKQLTDDKNRSFKSWADYLQCPEPWGLGMAEASAKLVMTELDDSKLLGDVLALDKATPNLKAAHRPKKPDNEKTVIRVSKYGTDPAYALARLRRDRPDIHARVLLGELSPHAGMIEAGFRKKAKSRKLTTFEKAAKHVQKLSKPEWKKLVTMETRRRAKK